MSRVSVDDKSSLIKYIGWWEENSVAHSAWDYGTQAKFTFKGTGVYVYGNIPDGDGETVRVDFSIDGGPNVSKYRTSGNRMISNVVWWESGTLSDGQHTVTMTYLSEDDMDFRLDRIEYIPSPPQESVKTSSPTSSAVNVIPVITSTRVAIVTQTSTSSRIEVVSGTSSTIQSPANLVSGVPTSSTSTSSTSFQPSSVPVKTLVVTSDGRVVTQTQYLPATSAADSSSVATSTSDVSPGAAAQSTSGSSKSVPVGAIVGGVIGSLAFLSLYLILFIVVRRKRVRRRERLEYGFAEGKGISSTDQPASVSRPISGVPNSQTSTSQTPPGITSKAALVAQERAQEGRHATDVASDMYTGYTPSETGHTVVTEAAPAYAPENFSHNRRSIRTWSSAVAEASHAGSESLLDQQSQPPAYR